MCKERNHKGARKKETGADCMISGSDISTNEKSIKFFIGGNGSQ